VWCGLSNPRSILDYCRVLQVPEFKAGTACSLYQPLRLHTSLAAFSSCDPCRCIGKDVATSELHSPSSSILAAGIWQIFPCSMVWLAGMEPKHLWKRTQLLPGLSHKNKSMQIPHYDPGVPLLAIAHFYIFSPTPRSPKWRTLCEMLSCLAMQATAPVQ